LEANTKYQPQKNTATTSVIIEAMEMQFHLFLIDLFVKNLVDAGTMVGPLYVIVLQS
jgi:hypothetical protein